MNGSATIAYEPLASHIAGMPDRRTKTHGEMKSKVTFILACVLFLLGIAALGVRLAGYQYVSTRGSSMEPTILSGSLLVVRQTPPQQIRPGDILAFRSQLEDAPNIVHRVVALEDDGKHIVALTMGDNNPVPDSDYLLLDKPMSRMVMTIPHLGWWITPALKWYMMAIALLLILKSVSTAKLGRGTWMLDIDGTRSLVPLELLGIRIPRRNNQYIVGECLHPFIKGKRD